MKLRYVFVVIATIVVASVTLQLAILSTYRVDSVVCDNVTNAIIHPIVFLHLPKTAGTTFTYMLLRAYNQSVIHPMSQKHESLSDFAQFTAYTSNVTNKWDFLSLHEDFSLLSFIPIETSVLTIIRSPVIHRRSVFYSGLNNYNKKYSGDILRWLLSDDYPTAYQLNFLAGVSKEYPKSRYSGSMLSELDSAKLSLAKKNLAATAWFGITERWNTSVCMFEHKFGKLPADYELHHVWSTNYPPARPNEVSLVSLRSDQEEELFAYAMELFEQRRLTTPC